MYQVNAAKKLLNEKNTWILLAHKNTWCFIELCNVS